MVFPANPTLAIEIVQLPAWPGTIESGRHVTETGPAVAVTVVVLEEEPTAAVMVTACDPVNAPLTTVNTAEVALAGTVIKAGTSNMAGALLLRETTVPPAGAPLDSVAVQDVVALDPKVVVAHCSDVIDAEVTSDIPV